MESPLKRHQRFYRTKVLPIQNGMDEAISGSAELGFHFINNIHRPVTVLTRTGLRIIIPYRPAGRPPKQSKKTPIVFPKEPCFIIRVRILTSSDVNLDTTELSYDHGHASSPEANAYLDSIRFSEEKLVRGDVQAVWVEYHIPVSDFDAEGGVLFLQNLDLQISILDQASTAPHPFSMLGQRNRDAFDFKEEMAPKGVFYGVYIRDRDGQYGSRFININGAVYGVRIIQDESTDRDGVYVVTTGRTTSSFVNNRAFVEYYTFDEADEKLGLYQTFKEALTLGNPVERYKREQDERIQKLRNDEIAFKEERAEVDRQIERNKDKLKRRIVEYEHELQRIQQLNKLIDAELNRRDQIYRREMMILKEVLELRGYERRETSELIKMIPTIITTAATWVAAYKKIKSL